MPAPVTADEYLAVARKSGILDETQLAALLQRLGPSVYSWTPKQLARFLIREGLATHFQAEQFLLGKSRGFSIGNYKVLERIGTGAWALVYLCEHVSMRRRVAVKVLPTATANDVSVLKRFYREARAAAVLDHPNIVRTFDIDQDENRHFMVMEYIEGGLLQDIVKRTGPMSVARACHYIRQAAVGLQHAHKTGLIHRDIKPDNLIVDRTGTVKILDMGLARFETNSDEVLTKGVLGTPDYLAPEQTQDSHAVDIRADIYSLGATFYFLLTGRTLFGEGTMAEKLLWHQSRQPEPIQQFRHDVPAELLAVINKMIAKDPAERYQTPAEVVDALEPFTRTPVPLPSEAEMPRLSPAVTRGTPAETSLPFTPPVKNVPPPAAEKKPEPPAAPPAPARSRPASRQAVAAPVERRRRRIRWVLYGLLLLIALLAGALIWVEMFRP